MSADRPITVWTTVTGCGTHTDRLTGDVIAPLGDAGFDGECPVTTKLDRLPSKLDHRTVGRTALLSWLRDHR